MPISDNITTELEYSINTASNTYDYSGITGLDTDRSSASQLIVLFTFNNFTDGTAVSSRTFTNWYDPFLLPLTIADGTSVLTFNDATFQVTVTSSETTGALGTVKDAGGTEFTRPLHDSGTKIRIIRAQDVNNKNHVFAPGSRVTSTSLNNAIGQVFDSVVELNGRLVKVESGNFESTGSLPLQNLADIPAQSGAAVKILQYNPSSTPIYEWIDPPAGSGSSSGDMTGIDITGGNGITLSQSNTTSGNYTATVTADLKSNGGIEIDSHANDLALNLGHAAINGTLAISDGGTGSTSAANARTALGLGTAATQATGIANTNVPKFTSGVADDDFLRVNGVLIEGRSAAEVLSDIGAQAADADLTAIAGLTSAADKGIQFTGSGTAGVYDLTAAGKALLDDANAAAQRTTLGITNVGAYTGQIEAAANKTYTLDPAAATARTITGFYIKSASGTVTATLKVGTDVVKAASVTSSSGDQTSLANTGVSVNEAITIVTTSNSSATDVIFSVEYTE